MVLVATNISEFQKFKKNVDSDLKIHVGYAHELSLSMNSAREGCRIHI